MLAELDANDHNHTWSLTSAPTNRKIVGYKWIYKVKRNSDGKIARYKARLVAKGFHQVPGFDFTDTFSPLVKPVTARVVLTVALSCRWKIHQLDINIAFLNEGLTEEVYMDQPPGFEVSTAHPRVCKLHKAIYGLEQAPRAWFEKLRSTLTKFGFTKSRADTSLFVRFSPTSTVYLLIYVDNIIITGTEPREVKMLISALDQIFSLKDLGPLSFFLEIEVKYNDSRIHLS